MEVVTHIGLIHFLSPIRSLSIFFLSLSKCSPHCFPISHWDKPFCGRHQGVPFSWRSLVGPFSWRCFDVWFSQGIQHESFSLMHQAELSPWRPFDGTRYSGPWASPHSWRSLKAPCSSALSFSCLRFPAETPEFGTTILLLLPLLFWTWGWIKDCEWVRFMYFYGFGRVDEGWS